MSVISIVLYSIKVNLFPKFQIHSKTCMSLLTCKPWSSSNITSELWPFQLLGRKDKTDSYKRYRCLIVYFIPNLFAWSRETITCCNTEILDEKLVHIQVSERFPWIPNPCLIVYLRLCPISVFLLKQNLKIGISSHVCKYCRVKNNMITLYFEL